MRRIFIFLLVAFGGLVGCGWVVHAYSQTARQSFFDATALAANIFTICASALAIYVYLANRDKIAGAIQMLLNFSFQTTLSELKEKLERLNEYNAGEPSEVEEIKNILHEIAGQIKGSSRLNSLAPDLAVHAENMTKRKKPLTEPAKRAFVSELREKLKSIQVNSVDDIK